jgi:hypothetical protein
LKVNQIAQCDLKPAALMRDWGLSLVSSTDSKMVTFGLHLYEAASLTLEHGLLEIKDELRNVYVATAVDMVKDVFHARLPMLAQLLLGEAVAVADGVTGGEVWWLHFLGQLTSGPYDNLYENTERVKAIGDALWSQWNGNPMGDCETAKVANAAGSLILDFEDEFLLGWYHHESITDIMESWLKVDKIKEAWGGKAPEGVEPRGFEVIMK